MLNFIKNELNKRSIELVSCLRLDECKIGRQYLLERNGISNGSVIIFAVPYFSEAGLNSRNVSAYAVSRDYHQYFSMLFEKIISELKAQYPDNKFAGFTDHSPIDEIDAAARAGLGVIGKNHLLITEKYSSFVFIGEIITDAILPSSSGEVKSCLSCGKCVSACPFGTNVESCLSALTQKKGDLTPREQDAIKSSGIAWGCDICQSVCPYTEIAIKNKTIFSNIDFFKSNLTPHLTCELVNSMTDEEFSKRAYSWRGKKVILRNLQILEGKEN